MTPSRSELVLQIALDIVRSGYAELPMSGVEVVIVKRRRYDRQYRLEQLQEASDTYFCIHGVRPNQKTLAQMVGMKRNSVYRLLKTGCNGK